MAYAYAVVPSPGTYGGNEVVRPVYCTNDLNRARALAKKLTAEYQRSLEEHGGTSGGYRAVKWYSRRTAGVVGRALDQYVDAV